MLKFDVFLTEEVRQRLQAERREVVRLYGLTNQWLASALLRMARQARKTTGLRPEDGTYDAALVCGVIPELARRLGVVRLELVEIDWEERALSDYALRQSIGYTLRNVSWRNAPAWHLLCRDVVHGNPVALGADRLCAGNPDDREDPLARSLSEIARVRRVPYAGVWTPEAFLPVTD